jgi:hypothetical protein
MGSSVQHTSPKRILTYVAGFGLVLIAAAVVIRFLTSLAVIRSYDADFLDFPVRSPID